LFPAGHPYHHPVIGWREDLERMTRDAVYRYYQQWYRPDRAILAVVGDVDAGDVFEFAARVFAAVEEPAPAVAAPEALAPPAETEFRIETEHQLSRLVVSHRGAPWTSEDSLALDVVAKILGEGRRSRLYQRLVERERLTREGGFSVWHDARAHAGVFHVVVELNPGADARRAAAAVVEEVERLGREPVSAEELARAQNLIVAAHVYQSEERITVAQEIARGWAMGTPDYWEKYPERIRGVTAGQVRAACAAYLHARARVIGIARGTAAGRAQPAMPGAKPCRTGGGRAGQPLQVPQDEAVRIPEIGEVQTVVFPNGLTLIIHPRRDLPIVAVRAYVEAGAAYDPEGKSGLSNLTGRMLDQGTYDPTTGRTRTHEEIAAWIEGVGGRLETDATSVLLQVLKPWESEGYDLLCDLLRHPSFPPDRLERVRDDVLAEIEGRDDHPAQFCRRLLREVVFQGHPLARPSEGLTAAQVRSITREDVVAHHERHYRPDRTIVAVVGDVTPLMVVEEIRRRLGVDWLPAREPLPAVPDVGRQGERRLLCVTRHTEQVNAALGHVGIPRSDPDFEAVRMMEYILYKGSGFTDRLSARVRDEAGLAYEVWGDMTGSADRWPGMLTIYVGTEARDKDRALGLIRETLVEFLRSGPRPEEMEAARSYLLRSFVFRWETNLDRAQYLIAVYRFGLGMDYHRRFHDAIRRMTAQDVLRAAQRVLRPDDLTVVLVGPVDARGNLIEEQR
jgi:zinc protease